MAWLAANAMLRQGKSWSGNERNCAFLNLGPDTAMANVASVSGFDFLNDGRALGATDWDHDGDIDFWVTNRNAPAVRFVENRLSENSKTGFISFRLTGVMCNRDAIGARLKLEFERKGESVARIQSVRAGDGFLAQSSKWITFGLGSIDGLQIRSLDIAWPDGSEESFDALEPNRRYIIVQDSGAARKVDASPRILKKSREWEPDEPSSVARIPLYSLLPFPKLSTTTFGGESRFIGGTQNKQILVNLWASYCAPCLEELAEYSRSRADLEKAGIEVVALCVDRLGGESDGSEAREFAKRTGPGIAYAWAEESTIDKLETAQRTLISGHLPLPLPSSFLLDRTGRIQAIYKGPVAVSQLQKDAGLEKLDARAARMAEAAPFPGRRRAFPKPIDPMQIALTFFEGNYRGDAIAYLQQLVDIGENRRPGYKDIKPAPIYFFLGALLEEDKDTKGAVAAFEKAAAYDKMNLEAYEKLINLALQSGQTAAAGRYIGALEKVNPKAANPHRMNLAQSLYRAGKHREAADTMRAVLKQNPGNLTAASNLAWILATNFDDEVRDGIEAVKWALIVVRGTGERDPRALDTLAAAHAEAGEFAKAVAAVQAALKLTSSPAQKDLRNDLQTKLEVYRLKKPWRSR